MRTAKTQMHKIVVAKRVVASGDSLRARLGGSGHYHTEQPIVAISCVVVQHFLRRRCKKRSLFGKQRHVPIPSRLYNALAADVMSKQATMAISKTETGRH